MPILDTIFQYVMAVFLCGMWIAAGIAAVQLAKAYTEYTKICKAREKARQEKALKKPYMWSNTKLNLSSSAEDDEDSFEYDF